MNKLKIIALAFLMLFTFKYGIGQNTKSSDSLEYYSNKTKSSELLGLKSYYLLKALKVYKENYGTYTLEQLSKLSFLSYRVKDTVSFYEINNYLRTIAVGKDSSLYAISYMFEGFLQKNILQNNIEAHRCYLKAEIIYDIIGIEAGVIYAKRNMADVLRDMRQYNAAENLYFEAIEYYKNVNRTDRLSSTYISLGTLYDEQKEYILSLEYYTKAYNIDFIKKDTTLLIVSASCIGNNYLDMGKYVEALSIFKESKKYLKGVNYRIEDNLIYTRYKLGIDTTNTEENFIANYQLKKTNNDKAGMIANRIKLSEYYFGNNEAVKSEEVAKQALHLSIISKNYQLQLNSYRWLLRIDSKNTQEYSLAYIALRDSIEKIDRKTRNDLGRIRMDTDFYIQKSDNLEDINYWLWLTLILGVVSTVLIVLYSKQRIKIDYKNNEIEKKTEVQKILIKESFKLEKAKQSLLKNISKELHDDILSRMFAIRINLNSDIAKRDERSIVSTKQQLLQLKQLEKDLRDISHNIKSNIDSNMKMAIENSYSDAFDNIGIELLVNDDVKNWGEYDEDIKIAIFRLVQESLKNVMIHSKANESVVSLSLISNELICDISDNGIGFDYDSRNKGEGIKNMYERAREIGASIKIQSKINVGTNIKFGYRLIK